MLQQTAIKEEMLPEQQELNPSVDQKDIKQEQEDDWTNEGQQLHRVETEKKTKLCFVPLKTEDEKPESSQVPQNSDMLQQTVIKEEMLPEQQELNQRVDQKDIKQEQEDDWTNEGQQLHRVETEKKTKLCFVPLKTEDEKPESSQVPQNSDMQMLVMKEEILREQQDRNLSVDQEDVKEEEEKLWMSPQVQQRHQLEEAGITKVDFSAAKSENDEKPQTSQVLQSQSDDITEAEPATSSSSELRTLRRQTDGEDDGEPEPGSRPDTNGRGSDYSETDCNKRKQTKRVRSSFDNLINGNVSVCHKGSNMKKKKYNNSENGEYYLKQEKGRKGSEKGNGIAPITTNIGQKPFTCSECGKRFGQKSHVITHMRLHTGHKPFSCSECSKKFVDKSSLNTHSRIHTGQKPFSCSECGKRFAHKSSLNTHMRIHTGQKPFSCSECSKQFGHKNSLVIHMRIHTGQKPFSCSECSKTFAAKSSLITHMRIHTGQKPFTCSECGKRFGDNSSLVRHWRIHTGQKPFNCSVCGKTFGDNSSLVRHSRIHTGQKPFSCSECDKSFAAKNSLIKHMKKHDPSRKTHQRGRN